MKKRQSLFLVLSALLLILCACGNAKKETETTTNYAYSQITVPSTDTLDLDVLEGKNLIYADISINPELGLFLDVDNNYTVVYVVYLNDDAKNEFSDTTLLNLTFEDAYKEVVSNLIEKGYVTESESETCFTSSVTFLNVDLSDTENILKPIDETTSESTIASVSVLTSITQSVQATIATEMEEAGIVMVFEEKYTEEQGDDSAEEPHTDVVVYDGYIGLQLYDSTTDYILYLFINGNSVVDSGIIGISPDILSYETYFGKSYTAAATDFINTVKNINANLTGAYVIYPSEQTTGCETVKAGIKYVITALLPSVSTNYISETSSAFATIIMDSHDYKNSDTPGEGTNEPHSVYLSTESELRNYINKNTQQELHLSGNITLNVTDYTYSNVTLICDGYSVTVKGTWNNVNTNSKHAYGLQLMECGGLDLSGLSFKDSEYYETLIPAKTSYSFIEARNSTDFSIANPSGAVLRESVEPGPFDSILAYDGSGADDNAYHVTYEPPAYTYEERYALELEMVTAILTNGNWSSCALYEKNDTNVWTDIVLNVGNVTLANMDYSEIRIRQSGSLKVSGTIAVTGSRLCFRIDNGGYLDLTGLALTKKHPSPDMVKVRFDDAGYVDLSKLYATATSGTIMFDSSSESFNITIW